MLVLINKEEVRRFLGVVIYLLRFFEVLLIKFVLFRIFLKNDVVFIWEVNE